MIISGYTDDRLSELKTYDKDQPYQVGYNGVTQIIYGDDGDVETIEYVIDDIKYITNLGMKPLLPVVFVLLPLRFSFRFFHNYCL